MADFFTRLSARTLGLGPIARPRVATPYEAAPHLPELNVETPVPAAAPRGAADPEDLAPAEREAIAPALAPHPQSPPRPAAPMRRAEGLRDPSFAARDEPARVARQPAVSFRPLVPPATSDPVGRKPAAEAPARDGTTLPPPSGPAVAPAMLPATLPPRADVAQSPRMDARPVRVPLRHNEREGDAAPTIQVTIGRIEVRAAPPPALPRPTPPRSALRSLDDYLKPRRRN